METLIKEFKAGNKVLRIYQEEDAENPRSWDNLTKMVAFHTRYSLGDKKHGYKTEDFNGWAELKKAIEKEDVAIIKPLYMYDHSGITIKTTPYECRWDSGQIGFVFITKKALRENFGVKRLTKKLIEQADKILEAEVDIYRMYIEGDVYRFEEIEIAENGEENDKDSCGGFFGTNWATNGIAEHVSKEIAEVIKAEAEEKKMRQAA